MNRKMCFCILCTLIGSAITKNSWGLESLPVTVEKPKLNAKAQISADESKRRLNDALLLLKRGKIDAAIYKLQQLEKTDPNNYKLLLKLGKIAIDAKNWAYAIQVFRKASFLHPKDIPVRLILMDIYKAYQMPIQEIIIGKEVTKLNPEHRIVMNRLAELYQEQSMQRDERKIRQKIKKLAPADYKNLKRLAIIFDSNGQHWEAAKIYEQIRNYYPDKLNDMWRLAALYDKLGEAFRQADVLDQTEEMGGGSNWMQSKAETLLRKQNKVYDPMQGGVSFKTETEPTMKVDTVTSQFNYTRIRIRSSLDFGLSAKFTHLNHRGIGTLDGNMDINNTSITVNATQHWLDNNLSLDATVGFSHDEISGRLFGRAADITAEDFPFLEDPSFDSFGGTIPVAKVQFTAKPSLHSMFNVIYEHNLLDDLDARLSLFTFNQITVAANYRTNDKTELHARIDNSFISDGNHRLHGLLSGYYTLWASTARYDYRSRRQAFLRSLPENFVRVGYEFEYFKDSRAAQEDKYQTFLNSEFRHKGVLLGQAELYSFSSAEQILASVRLSYAGGTTLDYQRSISARLFYLNPDFENEIGLSYAYEDSLSNNTSDANKRIAGLSKGHQISLNFKWRF